MEQQSQNGSPLVFTIDVTRLPAAGRKIRIEAGEDECRWLSREHGLMDIKRFVAELQVLPWRRDGARVTGTVEADIVQECVVTLGPVENRISESVDATYRPAPSSKTQREKHEPEIIIDYGSPDAPEMIEAGSLDLAALAIEHFSLGIDLYPRVPGHRADLQTDENDATTNDDKPVSPFAALAKFPVNKKNPR